ncbi:MFS transporter [Nocardia crassostreae]|uniref:MFS transporter n=1 Tax=Nocardia crassostreae TaxID=53428 RepID=UPI00082B04D8|nr:MFS transporter [Nocardia crassostreae]
MAIVFPLLEGRTYDWAPWTWLLLIAGIALVALVAIGEHRNPARRAGALLPLDLLRARTSSVALWVQLVAFAAFSGFLLVFVLWLQEGQGYTALRAGVVTVAFSVGGLAIAPLVGRLTVRFGRLTVAVGTLTGAIGTLAILGAATARSASPPSAPSSSATPPTATSAAP